MFVNDKAPSELVAQINSGNIKEGETLHFTGGNGWGDKELVSCSVTRRLGLLLMKQ